MIDTLFLKPLNMSIAAGWLILAVIVLRVLLKRAPKYIRCILWGIVGLRLVCPFSFESVFSLIPSEETLTEEMLYAAKPTIQSGVQVVDSVINPAFTASFAPPDTLQSANPLQIWIALAGCVWIFGMAVMVLYAAFSYLRVRIRVVEAMKTQGNIWCCDHVETPFILGLIRPRIYLPSDMVEEDKQYVIAHEQAHIKRGDHWWKPLGYALLTVYWFHPLCWIAYKLLCRDIELACDEKVVKGMDVLDKKAYSKALLTCSVPRHMISACPLAFGEVSVKERVKSVINYKKPAFWVTKTGMVCCMIAAVCFLTNPKEKLLHAPEPFCHSYRVKDIVFDAPWYSFTYFEETAPLFSFSSDYVMMAKDMQEEHGDWFQIRGGFEEVKLTKHNFDAYFKPVPGADGPTSLLGADKLVKGIRKENDKAWRMKVSESNIEDALAGEQAFYYLLLQRDGSVYLTFGYEDKEKDATHIRWLFELERICLVNARVYTEKLETTLDTIWYPDGGVDYDEFDELAEAIVYDKGTIELEVDFEGNTIRVGEDYYQYYENSGMVHRNTYELTRNADGKFILDVERKGNIRDEEAVYYVETPNGKCVFKVSFPVGEQETFGQENASDEQQKERLTIEEAVNAAIVEYNKDKFKNGEGMIYCASYAELATLTADASRKVNGKEEAYSEITVYALSRYQVYSSYDGELKEEGGCFGPVVINLEQDATGSLKLIEYQVPRDGSYYSSDIESMFPKTFREAVYNAQSYIEQLDEACLAQAMEYLEINGSFDKVIEAALDKISSVPLHVSMPVEFSQALDAEYEKLLAGKLFPGGPLAKRMR